MSIKLTKTEISDRDSFVQDLRTHLEKLSDLLEKQEDITQHAALCSVVIDEVESFRDDVATRLREEFDDKSEKWQDSDAGQDAGAFIDEWEQNDFSDSEIDLEHPETNNLSEYADALEALPTEP